MKLLRYALQTVIISLWREKWINFLTILSVSIGLSIVTAFIMITLNMDSVLQRWAKNFGVIVYLDEHLSREEETALQKQFSKDPDISNITFISKNRALFELKKTLGNNAIIIEGLDENPLPSSFELRLRSELLTPDIIKKKAAQLEKLSGVEEVQYGEKWLSSLYTISETMKLGAIVIGCAIFIAITFITYSTIKIFFFRRKDEIETLKLLGATRTFIRLPFLVEGFLIGILGGMLSSAVIYGMYSFTSLKMIEFLPSVNLFITSLPWEIYVIVPVAGASVSLIGSFIAVGKIRY